MQNVYDILETIRMIQDECLDIRTITMGISLLDCIDSDIDKACEKVYNKITTKAKDLVKTGERIEKEYGIPIIHKRIAVTPIAIVSAACTEKNPVKFALALQRAADTCGVNFIGGYSALVQKGFSAGDIELINSIPEALACTSNICSSINVGSKASEMLGVPFGIVDLSLAPTPAVGDSVAHILEGIGLESCGAPGTTAALALLNDAVKKGGVMASSNVGGLSGAFIPVSEDAGMIDAVNNGSLCIEKLEAMTAVCSVGLDMIVVPGDVTAETISAIIADEAAIGMVNNKTTAVRLIPAIGKNVGETLEFGGLLGSGPVMNINRKSPAKFISRGGRIPAPMHSIKN